METSPNSPANGHGNGRRKSAQRSRVGNGSALLSGEVDGRSVWCRRLKELIADHVADLGGEANCSTAERSIVRRAAVLTTELERMELAFALAGEASPDEIDLYARAASNLRRLLEAVGLQRRPRQVEGFGNDGSSEMAAYARAVAELGEAEEAQQTS